MGSIAIASALTPDAASEIRRALYKLPQYSYYITRLGLPQSAEKKGAKGKPMFEGEAAGSCNALYLALMSKANSLRDGFDTKKELREADARKHTELMALFVEPLLLEYGQSVWSPEEPYPTRISSPAYKKHLKCNDTEDCARITLYLYCWILRCVYRKLPGRNPDGDHQYENGAASAEDSDSDDNYTQEPPHQVTDEGFLNNGRSEAESSRTQLMPVAQMLPLPGDVDSKLPATVIVQQNLSNDTIGTPSNDEDILYENQDDPDSSHEPSSSRSIKRRDNWATQPPLPSTKRRKASGKLPVRTSVHPRVRRNMRCNVDGFRRQSASVSSVASAEPLVDDLLAREVDNYDDVGDDADSVLGAFKDPPIVPPSTTIPPTVTITDARLSEHINMAAQSSDLEDSRCLLAIKLLESLFNGLQQPNVVLLSDTVELLETLLRTDYRRLQAVYGDNLKDHEVALTRWLECLRSLLLFYELTGVKEDVTARNAFLAALPNGAPKPAIISYYRTRYSLSTWRAGNGRIHEGFVRQVTSILFNLASWGDRFFRIDQMEQCTSKFTQELLTWFEK